MAAKVPKTHKPNPSFKRQMKVKGPSDGLSRLFAWCDLLNPESTSYSFLTEASELATLSDSVSDAIARFHSQISALPFIGIILSWAQNVDANLVIGERYINCITDLLENNILPSVSDAKKVLLLRDLKLGDHSDIFDKIRSNKKWSIDTQEEYVSIYYEFSNWLSKVTIELIQPPFDSDRWHTSKRKLGYSEYLKIVKSLSERERILAKIFYLGGSRSLEEVLSLNIENIDFKNGALKLDQVTITYPKHVVNDIREYIGKRSKGYVFVGKSGEKIDHTVPYRALKTTVSKLNLDPSFTFKDFVTNV